MKRMRRSGSPSCPGEVEPQLETRAAQAKTASPGRERPATRGVEETWWEAEDASR